MAVCRCVVSSHLPFYVPRRALLRALYPLRPMYRRIVPFSGYPTLLHACRADIASQRSCTGLALVPIFLHTRTRGTRGTPHMPPVTGTCIPRFFARHRTVHRLFSVFCCCTFSCIVMWLCSHFCYSQCLPVVLLYSSSKNKEYTLLSHL